MMPHDCCQNCRFFKAREIVHLDTNECFEGICRRYPPRDGGFEPVHDWWWCGERQPKPEEPQ